MRTWRDNLEAVARALWAKTLAHDGISEEQLAADVDMWWHRVAADLECGNIDETGEYVGGEIDHERNLAAYRDWMRAIRRAARSGRLRGSERRYRGTDVARGRGGGFEAHPASIQDRDGGGPLLCASRGSFPFIEKVFADSGYAGERVATATVIAVEIVRKSPDQVGFAVQPRRWVVERFFAWINRNRRLAKDFEATIASARAFLYAASVMLLVRRLARNP